MAYGEGFDFVHIILLGPQEYGDFPSFFLRIEERHYTFSYFAPIIIVFRPSFYYARRIFEPFLQFTFSPRRRRKWRKTFRYHDSIRRLVACDVGIVTTATSVTQYFVFRLTDASDRFNKINPQFLRRHE